MRISLFTLFILVAFLLTSCATVKVATPVASNPEPVAEAPKSVPAVPVILPQLAWESSAHPERAEWSKTIYALIEGNFDLYMSATDLPYFCPKFASLSHNEKLAVWGDIWAWTAYYESSWNPASASVDVGEASDKNTWSVGLLQMSVVDQANYGFKFGYDYAGLKTATPNLTLASAIMSEQLIKQKKIQVKTGVYWSTLRDPKTGKSTKAPQIAGHVQKSLSFCN